MSTLFSELGIDQLSSSQRIALALEIWSSLDEDRPSAKISEDQLAELNRRDAELDAKPEIAMTWQQIRSRVEKLA